MVSEAEFILRVITLWFLVLSQFFRDGISPFKRKVTGDLGEEPLIVKQITENHSLSS